MENKVFNLHDSTIAHIAKIIQVSLLTGTDIIDHLRMVRMTCDESSDLNAMTLEDDYACTFDLSIDKMLENANKNLNKQD